MSINKKISTTRKIGGQAILESLNQLNSKELANAIRFLSIDAVELAKSGHPGAPMGLAEAAMVLWLNYLKHNPNNPKWLNRDRFILSNGHASMLIYSLLHLCGYSLSINDLKSFRQLHSATPGHPEYRETPGVETTTGPLGQGLANAVGFAIAERNLSARFNKKNIELINNRTYAFVGDGCLMEGISHEVCSLAGTLKLGKLNVLYDSNGISIDGDIKNWFSENVAERFSAYGWHVIENVDGHDIENLQKAYSSAIDNYDRPSIIICKTTIGYGSPNKSGTADSHGAALGQDEIRKTREALNWNYNPFEIPKGIYESWDCKKKGDIAEKEWNSQLEKYKKDYPQDWEELDRRVSSKLPSTWNETIQNSLAEIQKDKKNEATRKSSQSVLNMISPSIPELIGGSADLTGSNNTFSTSSKALNLNDYGGNYLFYGVREFGMSAIMNGIALYGGCIPYGGTFLVFSDYARNAVRMAALMKIRAVFVYTHDSIGLGEDGPTHQPVEHLQALRLIPNLNLWRPADRAETLIAWQSSIEKKTGPSCLILSRQSMPQLDLSQVDLKNLEKGGYILKNCENPIACIVATGSEVSLALEIASKLKQDGLTIRVISMPCSQIFDQQDESYKKMVLPDNLKKISIEAGSTDLWYKYTGKEGLAIGINQFGASAPAEVLFKEFKLDLDSCLLKIKNYLR